MTLDDTTQRVVEKVHGTYRLWREEFHGAVLEAEHHAVDESKEDFVRVKRHLEILVEQQRIEMRVAAFLKNILKLDIKEEIHLRNLIEAFISEENPQRQEALLAQMKLGAEHLDELLSREEHAVNA